MKTNVCCGKEMYQEISSTNYLISICRVCGKRIKEKVSFGNAPLDSVENFNIKLGEPHEDE